jgi:hypothetical protein
VVRLVSSDDKKPIDNAVITEAKTDMGPSGMAAMSGTVSPATSDQPGVYRFLIETSSKRIASTTLAGRWFVR